MIPYRDMLAGHWLPVCKASRLRKKPVGVQLLGERIVLFRTQDGISALRDRCPHRNVPLSEGRITENCIQCPYHGWAFDGTGLCRSMPGAEEDDSCTRHSVPAYTVREEAGLVWVCLSPADNDLVLPEHVRDRRYDTRLWSASAEGSLLNALENFLDGTHTHYVHKGVIRHEGERKPVTCTLTPLKDRVEVVYSNEGNQNGLVSRFFEPKRSDSKATFLLPCIARLDYRNEENIYFALSAYIVPQSEGRLSIFAYLSHRKSFIPGFVKHALVYPFFKLTLAQDLKILKKQKDCIESFGGESFIIKKQDLLRPFIHRLLNGQDIAALAPEIRYLDL